MLACNQQSNELNKKVHKTLLLKNRIHGISVTYVPSPLPACAGLCFKVSDYNSILICCLCFNNRNCLLCAHRVLLKRQLSRGCVSGTACLERERGRRKMLRGAQCRQSSNCAAAYQNSLLRCFLKCRANLAGSEPGGAGVEQLMTEELLLGGLLCSTSDGHWWG